MPRGDASTERPDAVVVGAGILGLCTAWYLREAGARVLVLDPAPGTGHSLGSGRMFRLPHRDRTLTELAADASSRWDELARALPGDGPLLVRVGSLHARRTAEDLAPLVEALRGIEQPGALLEPGEVHRRWPVLAIDPPAALHDPGGGRIEAAAAIRRLLAGLRQEIVPARVRTVRMSEGGADLETAAGPIRTGALILAAGLETRALAARAGMRIRAGSPLAASRLTLVPTDGPTPRIPCIHERSGSLDPGIAYLLSGEWGGVSIGLDSRPEMLSPPLLRRIVAAIERGLPGLGWRQSASVAARLELPDEADHDRIELHRRGRAWAPHGWNLFKHAPALGRRLAREVSSGDADGLLDRLPGQRS